MKNQILSLGLLSILFACNPTQIAENQTKEMTQTKVEVNNPLLKESTLPYGAPDFRIIEDEHYLPAMKEALRLQLERVQKIVSNSVTPTFDNTILALEKSGKERSDVSSVFFAMTSAHTNDRIKEIQEILSPIMAEHSDEIYLNSALFNKVKSVYDNLSNLNLDAES